MLTSTQLTEAVPQTVEYAKGSPENIGHSVCVLLYEILANLLNLKNKNDKIIKFVYILK